MRKLPGIIILLLLVSELGFAQIAVHSSGKYFVESKTKKAFFWLGDTGWELFHRLNREDVIHYLDRRKKQGFNLIQAVALAENNGLTVPNRYGDVPLKNLDPTTWDVTPGSDPANAEEYDYWDHVDFVIAEAAKRNLYVGLLPTWGDKVAHLWGDGPRIFNKDNAYTYANMLAERYKGQWNVVWILGGDRPGTYEREGKKHDDRPVYGAMAKGIEDVWGKEALISYHPGGSPQGSSEWFHNDDWLDFNALQSGHGDRRFPIWDYIRNDLKLLPAKPTMDMEPAYEDHAVNPWDDRWSRETRGYFSPDEVRGRIYRSVFAGGAGVTYGHVSIWQFMDTSLYEPVFPGDTTFHWRTGLKSEVATQMHHLKDLMYSVKDFDRVEDSLLIMSDRGRGYQDLIIATRNVGKTYALLYLPQTKPVKVNLDRLRPGRKKISWFSPVTGKSRRVKTKHRAGIHEFHPPVAEHPDWILRVEVCKL